MNTPTLELPIEPPAPHLPSVVGYRVEGLCGSGGMARVFKAIEEGLERPVAIKILSAYGHEADALRERFEREARLVATLQHPAIVSIYRVTRTRDGDPCIVMPWLNGTLAERPMPMPEVETRELLSQLLDALEHAHQAQIVHRDLKPENVLFDASGRPLLADFGVALRVGGDARITGPGMTVGSARYMSPEQALGREVDIRSDLYSLGIMAFELLTGAAPFEARDAISAALAHVEAPVPRLPYALGHWQTWIDRALAKQPEGRFDSAAEMRETLPVAPSAVITQRVPRPPRRGNLRWAGALALMLLMAALLLSYWLRDEPKASAPSLQPVVLPEPGPLPTEPQPALQPALTGPIRTVDEPAPVAGAEQATVAAANDAVVDLPGPGAAYARIRDGADGPWLVPVPAQIGTSTLKAFAVSQTEITRVDYQRFVDATGRRSSNCNGHNWRDPGFVQAADHPVVCVSFADARAYADWLSGRTGKKYRLPSLAEWRHLSAPIAGEMPACEQAQLSSTDCPRALTTSVETFVASTPGVFGLIGNVREWTSDCQWQVKKRNVVARGFSGVGRWMQGKEPLPKETRTCIGRYAAGSSFKDAQPWPQPVSLGEQQVRSDLGFRVVREP